MNGHISELEDRIDYLEKTEEIHATFATIQDEIQRLATRISRMEQIKKAWQASGGALQ